MAGLPSRMGDAGVYAAIAPYLALGASVTFNVLQLRATKRLKNSYRQTGTFQSGELFDEIIDQCRSLDPKRADFALRIVSDFAAYGSFSHPVRFGRYLDAIRRRADNGSGAVNCIFLDDERKREVLYLQFKKFPSLLKTVPFQRKIEAHLATDFGRAALKDLGLAHKMLDVATLTLEDWVKIILLYDRMTIRTLQAWGVTVLEYPHLLSVHVWSGQRDQTVMAVVDFEGIVNEIGFVGTGDIATNMRNIVDIFEHGVRTREQWTETAVPTYPSAPGISEAHHE